MDVGQKQATPGLWPDKMPAWTGRSPAQRSSYLPAWLSSSRSCLGLLGLLCHSGVLGSAGCWVGAAGSPWPPLGAPGLSFQVSPSLVTAFFSKPVKALRKNECPYGAGAVELVLAHSLHADVISCGHSGLLSWRAGQRGAQHRPHVGEQSASSSGGPQHRYSLPLTKAASPSTPDDFN